MKKKGKKEKKIIIILIPLFYGALAPELPSDFLRFLPLPTRPCDLPARERRASCARVCGTAHAGPRDASAATSEGRRRIVSAVATRANVACQDVVSTPVNRYFQAPKHRLGHANESGGRFLFISDVINAPSAPWATRAGRLGQTFARRIAIATVANVGIRGPAGAQKKAVAGRGDIQPPQETCGTVPHGIALPGF